MLTIGSLFSGIGGLELGLERAGLGPVRWQVEIDPYCRAVLAKHWPDARRYEDVRDVGAGTERVDVVCGGFPCQDLSRAGPHAKGLGLAGSRSGLWSEYARILGIVRPRYVVVENVTELASNGLDRVLADLALLGFDALWFPVAAADVGATHLRHRLFVVAYADEVGRDSWREDGLPAPVHGQEREGSSQMLERSLGHDPAVDARQASWGMPESEMVLLADGFSRDVVRRNAPAIGALGNAVVPQVAEVVGWVVRGIAERVAS